MSVLNALTALAWIMLAGVLVALPPAVLNLRHARAQEAQRIAEGSNGLKESMLGGDLRRAWLLLVGIALVFGIAAFTLTLLYFPIRGLPASVLLYALAAGIPYEMAASAWSQLLRRERQIAMVDEMLVKTGVLPPGPRRRRYLSRPWRRVH